MVSVWGGCWDGPMRCCDGPMRCCKTRWIEARRLFSGTHDARETGTIRADMFCGRSKSRQGSAVEDNKRRRFKCCSNKWCQWGSAEVMMSEFREPRKCICTCRENSQLRTPWRKCEYFMQLVIQKKKPRNEVNFNFCQRQVWLGKLPIDSEIQLLLLQNKEDNFCLWGCCEKIKCWALYSSHPESWWMFNKCQSHPSGVIGRKEWTSRNIQSEMYFFSNSISANIRKGNSKSGITDVSKV